MASRTPARRSAGAAAKARKSGRSARGKLAPRSQKRGLAAELIVLPLDAPEISGIRQQVASRGGAVIGAYREPLSGRPMILAALPVEAVQPTPFQRDLSPTHTQRLAAKIEEAARSFKP